MSIGKDITDRLHAEQALKSAYEEVEALKDWLEEEITASHNFHEIIGQSQALT